MRNRCAIVGIGATEFSRASGRTVLSLACEASLKAITDAGLRPRDIDGLVRCDIEEVEHNDLAESLGFDLTFWSTAGFAGGAPSAMVGHAVAAILSGQANAVLVYRSLNGRSATRLGQGSRSTVVGGHRTYDEYFVPYGLVTPGQLYAMIARRHMIEFGTTREQLAQIALACRSRANANPSAQMFGRPLGMADYLDGRMISDPLCLFDYCLETDGACAVVVTSASRAVDCRHTPILIRAVAQASPSEVQPGPIFPSLMRPTLTTQPSSMAAATLYKRAGMGPSDIDVAQFYDCFTITVLLQIEDYGFCAKGEGGAFAESGALELDGTLPINTSGGHLSEGYLHGMNHIVEGVRQLRGESTSPVLNAEVCLITSGIPTATSAMILTRP